MNKRKKRRAKKSKFIIRRAVLFTLLCLILILSTKAIINKFYSSGDDSKIENNIVEQEPPKPKGDDILSGSNVTYDGEKFTMDKNDVHNMLNGKYEGEGKHVFLTFDDGPSKNTGQILDILQEKDVKATFFILGEQLEKNQENKDSLKRELKEGHAIGNHTYTHDMETLYANSKVDINLFMEEINKTNNAIKDVVGSEFDTKVIRMPGGYISRAYYKDPNLGELDKKFEENELVSIDWNCLNGDAEGKPYTLDEMLAYTKKTSKEKKNVVILMHDSATKEKTVQILPEIIDYFKEEGYEFKTIR